jgi:hypothetical protein
LKGARLTRRSKVGERPDGRAPPVGLWRKKKRGGSGSWAGGRGGLGRWADCARAKKKAAGLVVCGLKEMVGRQGEKRGRGRKFFLFLFFFQIRFQTFKLQTNRNPCIQIMMHKHLLFLDYFSDV